MVVEPWCDGGGGDAEDADGEVGGREDDVNNVDEEQSVCRRRQKSSRAEVEERSGRGQRWRGRSRRVEEVLEDIEAVREIRIGFRKIPDGIFALMDKNLIFSVSTGESKMFYLAEFATDEAESKVASDVAQARRSGGYADVSQVQCIVKIISVLWQCQIQVQFFDQAVDVLVAMQRWRLFR